MEIRRLGAGKAIPYELQGSVLVFNEGELTLDLAKHQRDFDRQIDICQDKFGGLTMGLGEKYVAQIGIPAREYEYEPTGEIAAQELNGENNGEAERQPEVMMNKKALPLDMDKVWLALWGTKEE